jgi:hypothetical protein
MTSEISASEGNSTQPRRSVGRRGFLGAAVPAVALIGSTALGASPAQADTPGSTPITTTTLAALRALATADPDAAYYVTDPGAEGVFLPDPGDITSPDDTGLVIVSAAGERLKRVVDGAISVTWFGAKGDGQNDDGPAIQAAVDAGHPGGRAIYFPATTAGYAIKAPIILHSTGRSQRLFGESMPFPHGTGSCVMAHPSIAASDPLEAIFKFDDTATTVGWQFDNMMIFGRGVTKYGIYSKTLTHTLLWRVYVAGATTAGIALGRGWCVDIVECEIYLNQGDGIQGIDNAVNNLNITNSKVFGNGGVGIALLWGSYGVRISGCDIEANAVTGILSRTYDFALNISENYFESNGKSGYTAPIGDGRPIQAQIIILGGTPGSEGGGTGYEGPVRVVGNNFSIGNPVDNQVVVAAYDVIGGLDVSYNSLSDPRGNGVTDAIVLTGTSKTGNGSLIDNLSIKSNGMAPTQQQNLTLVPVRVDPADLPGAWSQLHQADIEGVVRTNYSQALLRFEPLTRGAAGSWQKDSTLYRRSPVYVLAGDGETGTWGFTLDLAKNPELAGRLVYFACAIKTSDPDTAAALMTSQLGDGAKLSTADWQVLSYVDMLPNTGTVSFGISMRAGKVGSTILVSAPVLAEVGARYDRVPPAESS